MKFFLFLAIVFIPVQSCANTQKNDTKEITLRLEPQQGNPRNSEGDFK